MIQKYFPREKKKKIKVNASSIKEQIILFVRCDVENPSFDSQTKDFMNTPSNKFGSSCVVSDKFVEKIAKLGVMDAACALTEIKEIKPDLTTSKEAVKISAAIPKGAHVIALDERGKDQTTQNLATQLTSWRQEGTDVAFLIGGADGLDSNLKRSAQEIWRLSSLTLPHAMARIVLTEQLYRAWTILQGHPYHRE